MRGCHMHGKPFLRAAWDEPMQAVGFFRACLTIIAGHMLPGLCHQLRSAQWRRRKKLKRIVIPLGATHNVLFACPQH